MKLRLVLIYDVQSQNGIIYLHKIVPTVYHHVCDVIILCRGLQSLIAFSLQLLLFLAGHCVDELSVHIIGSSDVLLGEGVSNDSIVKIEDTLVKCKMPNISETGRKTFTKFSVFWEVVPRILSAKYGGDMPTQFLGRRWES